MVILYNYVIFKLKNKRIKNQFYYLNIINLNDKNKKYNKVAYIITCSIYRFCYLITVGQSTHPRHNTEDVVVDGKDLEI